ncbi:MAG: hypothetical protein HYS74_02940 [Parcubacteria group bacterium]|nr:hypothetical protein [Parcubacteria group bacterium]
MLRQHAFLFSIFAALVILAGFHLGGLFAAWYLRFTWLDASVHFLGGVWISGMFLWFLRLSGLVKRPRTWPRPLLFIGVAVAALAVGILWELFELAIGGASVAEPDYAFDTATDLIADTLGIVAAMLYFLFGSYDRAADMRETR